MRTGAYGAYGAHGALGAGARGAIIALNVLLALAMHVLAPAEPILNDRDAYEYVGAHPLAANCPFSIYCYRPMAPVLVSWLPFESNTSWRVYQVTANAAAGAILAGVTTAPLLASVITQTSYGFAFTAYDPYAADPLVFVFAALLTWCWMRDRWKPAIVLAVIGIFAKETVALLAVSLAVAAWYERRPDWRRWVTPAASAVAALALFHLVSRVWLNWEIASNPAAQAQHGWWIGLWWRNNPFIERKLYILFATFGLAWIFAALEWRTAPRAWRGLALGALCALTPLLIVQTPERAIGNAFYAVVPLAAAFAARGSSIGAAAVLVNGLVTAKAGTSSAWLPSGRWLLLPAAIAAVALIGRAAGRQRAVKTRPP